MCGPMRYYEFASTDDADRFEATGDPFGGTLIGQDPWPLASLAHEAADDIEAGILDDAAPLGN